ncbi:MAG: hypothetical protein HQ495_10350 [Alphaproteobacteria bacterium]|nr:hypothetical protein [Alphaproteobacteria bacterium]
MSRFLMVFLALALVVVAGGVWLIPADQLGPDGINAGEARTMPPPAARLTPRPIDDFAALANRPPFSASRRAPAATAGNDENLILGRYRLAGVIVAPTARSVILSGANSVAVIVAEGEEIDGWTVDEITVERVVFVSGVRSQTFQVAQPGR